MWFRFPEGVTQISVQQQLFESEIKDKDGRDLFRAPDHFAPIILDQPGFSVPSELPENAPADLEKTLEPEVSKEVEALAGQLRQKDFEIENLKSTLAEMSVERDDLKLKVHELEAKVGEGDPETKPKETDSKPSSGGFSRDKK